MISAHDVSWVRMVCNGGGSPGRLRRDLTNFRLDRETLALGKSTLLPLKYSGFLCLSHSSAPHFKPSGKGHSLAAFYHPPRHGSHNDLHHGQVFQIIMRLEERLASVEFDENAAY